MFKTIRRVLAGGPLNRDVERVHIQASIYLAAHGVTVNNPDTLFDQLAETVWAQVSDSIWSQLDV